MAGKDTELDPAAPLDGSEIVGVVQGGVSVRTTLGDIAALATGGGGTSVGTQYVAELSSAADSDPGAGLLKWNHATQASATVLFLDDTTADGANLTGWWSALDAGGFCYLQHATDQDTWQIWEITAVTDATGYVKLGVTLLAAGDAFADGDPMLVTLQQGGSGGGAGDFSGPGSSTDNALVRFDGAGGKTGQSSGVLVTDANEISGYKGNINRQTGTSYTLIAADSGKIVELANAASIALTADPALPAGFCCTIVQALAGVVTIASTGSGTVVNRQSQFKTAGANALCTAYVRSNSGSNAVFVFGGDTAA